MLALLRNEGAATGRSLVRDMYADGNWNTYSQLCAIVPQGGSVGSAAVQMVLLLLLKLQC